MMNQIKNKMKFYMSRKSKGIILWILTLISAMLLIKTSDDPIVPILKDTVLERSLDQFPIANDFIWDISIGFFVSLIFYLIVVYFPDKQKQKDVELIINGKCESVIFSSYALIFEIVKQSKLGFDYKTLTENQMFEVCKAVNPTNHLYSFAITLDSRFEHHLGYKISNDWSRIISKIDDIFRFLPYIDTGLLKRLHAISDHFLRYTAKDLANFEKLGNSNLEAWSKSFFEFYIFTKDLRDYYRLYSKSEFNNDPWK